jgi:membrane glycosyltransferase
MLLHSKFVLLTLLGRQVGWGAQKRIDSGTSWSEALRFHGPGMLLALAWGTILFVFNRSFFWWNTPVLVPLLLSIPLSVWSGRTTLGKTLRKLGLLLIPEETERPEELRMLDQILLQEDMQSASPLLIDDKKGFVRAVVDPQIHRLHLALARRKWKVTGKIAARRRRIVEKALSQGPGTLTAKEKRELLYDPECLKELHQRVWEISDPALEKKWGLPP